MSYFRVDVRNVFKGRWETYVHELGFGVSTTTKATAKEDTVTLIQEALGVSDPQIVWSEC